MNRNDTPKTLLNQYSIVDHPMVVLNYWLVMIYILISINWQKNDNTNQHTETVSFMCDSHRVRKILIKMSKLWETILLRTKKCEKLSIISELNIWLLSITITLPFRLTKLIVLCHFFTNWLNEKNDEKKNRMSMAYTNIRSMVYVDSDWMKTNGNKNKSSVSK